MARPELGDGHRQATTATVLDVLVAYASGRPQPELIVRWVHAMLEDDDLIDSKEVAHAFRCEEAYVCWCCEVGIRRGELQRAAPRWRLTAVAPPIEAWTRSRLDPLARLALEATFDDVQQAATAARRAPSEGSVGGSPTGQDSGVAEP